MPKKRWNGNMAKILSRGEFTTLRLTDDSTVTKTAIDEGAEKLAKEIEFLELNKSKFHYDFLPDVFSHEVKEGHAYYSMPYLSGPLLRDYIYSEPDFSLCEQSLEKTIANLDSLHRQPGIIDAAAFSKKYYFERLRRRWEKLKAEPNEALSQQSFSMKSISSSDARSIFSLIAKGTTLLIDGREISFSIEHLANSLASLEEVFEFPQTSIRLIHGDPHAGNILLHNDEAFFLDPNGFMEGGDVAYDFGKLLVSFDWHDLSMMNMLESANIDITVNGLDVANNKVCKDDFIQKRHQALRQKIMEQITKKVVPLYMNDPLLLRRIELLLYVHQFSFAPTLIKEKPGTALHILLNAISDYSTFNKEGKFSFL